jgi:hypothetical protein
VAEEGGGVAPARDSAGPASAVAAAGKSGEARAELGNTRRGKLPWGPGKA